MSSPYTLIRPPAEYLDAPLISAEPLTEGSSTSANQAGRTSPKCNWPSLK